jgi:hypothetical protein
MDDTVGEMEKTGGLIIKDEAESYNKTNATGKNNVNAKLRTHFVFLPIHFSHRQQNRVPQQKRSST